MCSLTDHKYDLLVCSESYCSFILLLLPSEKDPDPLLTKKPRTDTSRYLLASGLLLWAVIAGSA
jgi:hypothetical protein